MWIVLRNGLQLGILVKKKTPTVYSSSKTFLKSGLLLWDFGMCWAIVTFYTLPKVNNSTHLHTCSTWKFVLQLRRILQHISFEKYLAQQLCKCSKIGFSQPDTQNTNWLLWSLFLFFLPNYLEIAGLCNGHIHFSHERFNDSLKEPSST